MTLQPYKPHELVKGRPRVEALTQEDYLRIKDHMPTRRAILVTKLLRVTGIRVSELLDLDAGFVEDDPPFAVLKVTRGKSLAPADVFIPGSVAVELREHIRFFRLNPGDPLFPGRKYNGVAHKYSRVSFWKDFTAASRAALGAPANPHLLRDLYEMTVAGPVANELNIRIDNDLASIMLGHASTKTTRESYNRALTVAVRKQVQEAVGRYA